MDQFSPQNATNSKQSDPEVTHGSTLIRDAITQAIETKTGLLIGRFGTIEFESMTTYMLQGSLPNAHMNATLERNAGIWPRNAQPKWVQAYHRAAQAADIMAAGWYAPMAPTESNWFTQYNPQCKQVRLRSLEPYYVPFSSAWTNALAGQKVAVVSSFAETIYKQLEKRRDIWPTSHATYLPDTTTFLPINTYYSPSLSNGNITTSWPPNINSWKDAVDSIVASVLASDARIALIGCGGLAMPIAHALKNNGIIAIVMGGAIQVLFGIKGKRWEKHPVISQLWNDHWVYPSMNEIPYGAHQVEGGCYW